MSAGDFPERPQGLLRWPSYALGQLHRIARSRMDAALAEQGLSLRTHAVLVCLDESGRLSQQQVADRAGIDRSDLVKLIDQLESVGRVVRSPDPNDRRRHVLSLTAKGRRAIRQAEGIAERVSDDVFANLTKEERQTLHRLTLKALGEATSTPRQT